MKTDKVINLYIPLSREEKIEYQRACDICFTQNSQALIRKYISETLKKERFSPKYKVEEPSFIGKLTGAQKKYILLNQVKVVQIEKPHTECMTVAVDGILAYLFLELCSKKGQSYHEMLRAWCLQVIAAKRELAIDSKKENLDSAYATIIALHNKAITNNRLMKTKIEVENDADEQRIAARFATATWR